MLTLQTGSGFRDCSGVSRRDFLRVGEKVEFANQAETATIRIVPAATKTVEWRVSFAN